MKSLEKLLDGLMYSSCCVDEQHLVVILFGYSPFKQFPDGHLVLDNYYVAANAAYRTTNQILQQLNQNGFNAKIYQGDYKRAVVNSGLGVLGKNNLVANSVFGSYFVVQVLQLEKVPQIFKTNLAISAADCGNCNACVTACPTAALNGGYDKHKCLRFYMDGKQIPDGMGGKMGNSLLGCLVCRQVCPKNAKILPVDISTEVLTATSLQNLKAGVQNNNLSSLKQLIGTNMAKVKSVKIMLDNYDKHNK